MVTTSTLRQHHLRHPHSGLVPDHGARPCPGSRTNPTGSGSPDHAATDPGCHSVTSTSGSWPASRRAGLAMPPSTRCCITGPGSYYARPQPAQGCPADPPIRTAASFREQLEEVMALPGIVVAHRRGRASPSLGQPRHLDGATGTHPLAGAGGLAGPEAGRGTILGLASSPHPARRGDSSQPGYDGHGATVCTRSGCPSALPGAGRLPGAVAGNPTSYPHSKPKKRHSGTQRHYATIIRHGDQLLLVASAKDLTGRFYCFLAGGILTEVTGRLRKVWGWRMPPIGTRWIFVTHRSHFPPRYPPLLIEMAVPPAPCSWKRIPTLV